MKHTKGPWKADKPEKSNGFWNIDQNGEFGIESAATCYGENAEANAKLIAAAPEMLEELKYALEYLENCVEPDNGQPDIVEGLKAIIKKATE